jgi:arginyl-tRNA synthetase
MTLRDSLHAHVRAAIEALRAQGELEIPSLPRISLAPPKMAAHGDYSTPVALALAKGAKKPPRQIAEALKQALGDGGGLLDRIELAGPGHLNFFVRQSAWRDGLYATLQAGDQALQHTHKNPERILLEYVSANPTGPLHVAHGRGAVHGDTLARLLGAAGHVVEREYYVNDMGRQTDVMAESIYLRYAELLGRPFVAPKDFYPGEYITAIAQGLIDEVGDRYLDAPQATWHPVLRTRGITQMLVRIKADLAAFNVSFDTWVSEASVCDFEQLRNLVSRLETSGHIFIEDGKTWFRSTTFGDDKDRVVLRDDGRPTYFLTDLAYHDAKMSRGFDRLINVWGADHGGYVARIKAGLTALGHNAERLSVLLMQMVSLTSGGEAVRMGKRLGTAVWLDEVIAKAGSDATRYLFSMRRLDTQMDFDIDLAMQRSIENPVYYAQMGHARLAAIGRKAQEQGIPPVVLTRAALDALVLTEELQMMATLGRAQDVIADAAEALEPHQLVHYMQDLIAQFHSYYTRYKHTHKVVSEDNAATQGRLLLCRGLQQVLKLLLELLGVAAPEKMALDDLDSAAPAAG